MYIRFLVRCEASASLFLLDIPGFIFSSVGIDEIGIRDPLHFHQPDLLHT